MKRLYLAPEAYFSSRGWFYGWVVVGVMFANLFVVMGIRFSFGVVYVVLLEDTGWSRGATASIFSVSMVVYALAVTLSGAMLDRLGPRKLFPGAHLLMGVALLLTSGTESLWGFYIYYGVLVGFSFSMLGFPTHMALVPRWFQRRRGLASSLALAGTGLGSLGITLLTKFLVVEFGWRVTFFIFGLLLIGVMIPLNLIFLRDAPEAVGQRVDGAKPVPAPTPGLAEPPGKPGLSKAGFTLGMAMRTPAYWLMFLGVTLLGVSMMTLVVHQTRLSVDLGYSLGLATTMFGLSGLGRTLGGFVFGPLSDHFGRALCFAISGIFGVLGMVLLILARFSPEAYLLIGFVVLFAIGYNGITPVYASALSDLFPGRHLGKIMGALDIGFGLGSALGPWMAGALFDWRGNYDAMLGMMLVLSALTGVAFWLGTRLKPTLTA
ncbi:MAG: MFS transporter [Deltaproteobacteria bacterium]|nr:MFS transporter [Deltaproteobacteria bacterium]